MKKTVLAAALGTVLAGLMGCQSAVDTASEPNTLVAVASATAPKLENGAADAVWAKAKPLAVELTGGANFGAKPGDKGESKAVLKAVYTADMLYMLVQYNDPTHSIRRGPFQKQADGSWKKLADPDNKGGDDNVYYEDKWAMIWPIDNSIKKFDVEGCAVMCHTGEGKPYGNKYTMSPGEMGDIWHMKGQRTAPLGFIDDQYVDDTRYDAKKSPNAGRKSDPGGTLGEYTNFALENGKPKYMARDGKAANAGGTYYIKRGEEVAFDDSKFKPGDEVASIIINPLEGDRADLKVAVTWAKGVHTSVLSRKLVTGSKYDVQFKDLSAKYAFGFAAFDNAQVRHATPDDALFMKFAK